MFDPITPKRPSLRLTGVVGVAISAFFLWWTLRDVALAEVFDHMRQVRLLPFLAMVTLATLTFPIRTIRWRYLLQDEGRMLPFLPLWHATAVGFMVTNVIPARAGEFARAYVAQRVTTVRFTSAFASLAVERVMDGLVLVALLVVATWAGEFSTDTTLMGVTVGGMVQAMGAVFGVALLVAVGIVHWPGPATRLTDKVSHTLLPDRWADQVVSLLEGLLSGLDSLRSPRRFAFVLLWSVILWLVNAYSFYVGFSAFGIDAPWTAALFLNSAIAFAVALPSAPGFFGVFEAAAKAALALYAIAEVQAVSYGFGFHLGTFLPITLLGMWSLTRVHLGMREITGGTGGTEGTG